MVTVAIIHAAEDALPARALAEKLRQARLTVVLEKQAGEEQRAAVKDAKVTVALWSPRSNGQRALIDDASYARGKSKLIHACMQDAPAPEAFRNEKIINLTGWRGEDDFPAWRELAKLVTDRAGVSPLPPPAPKPPSGFFQPGVVRETQTATAGAPARGAAPPPRSAPRAVPPPPPRPSAAPRPRAPAPHMTQPAREKGGGGRMALIGIVTFIVVALIGGGGYYFWTQQNAGVAASAWEMLDRTDAHALRAFIDGEPGEYRDEAEQALAELEQRSFEAASDADSIEALEAFLNDFPQSDLATRVRGRIAELQSLQPPALATPAEVPATPAPAETESGPQPAAVAPAPETGEDAPASLTPPPAEPQQSEAPSN